MGEGAATCFEGRRQGACAVVGACAGLVEVLVSRLSWACYNVSSSEVPTPCTRACHALQSPSRVFI